MLSQNAKLSQFCLKIPRLFAKNKIRSFSSTVHLLNDNLEQRASYPTRAVLYVPGIFFEYFHTFNENWLLNWNY